MNSLNPLHPHRKRSRSPASTGSPSFRGPDRAARGLLTTAALLLIPLLVLAGGDGFRAALDHTTGVLSLVALTSSVAWGLVASDRLFLRSRQRLLAQAVHRATAVASVGFLLLHGTVKLALDHVSAVGALIPFGLGVTGGDGLIGLGSLAGLLMVTTSVTGALRSAFASPVQVASRWRALHMLAYPAWCAALIHGLYAGRPPKPWVVALYCLCLVAVAGAMALRTAPRPVKRKVAARILAVLEPDGRGAPGRPRRRSREAVRDTGTDPLPGTAPGRRGVTPEPASVTGIAAAYRALATLSEEGEPGLPPADLTPDLTTTEVLPTVAPRWPTPSPPPPAEAPGPPFPYDSVDPRYDSVDPQDTQHDYGDSRFGAATGPQPAYHPPAYDPPYDPPCEPAREGDGSAEQPLLGPFQAPSTGEPWSAPAGGSK
ncbi:cytochrome b/b6 domain-containing protein [Streptomyces spectabilis]|uniref:DMSO/TMAO reductase YedYZ heme-binding membrane subunit n=1 Tax=Streptomyces spectabilis TaxID=68270 RepID=A0A7W8EU57_STRST|nr:cytochrome b/b6 domain-containing protein [Streptomyces spectabilis]MBB5103469.1 DMSO/TMAO reductase YedYZ heme-binding membrane subunit [Streptomyces spectabilis]MCI3902659.1 cytochrome b/b6 domain-containing protein [Streptomyces spectabilis]GGV49335.1 membrane protein [Streptomyces spectabilis]